MGGKTSVASKEKYNAKAYEHINVRVKKGEREAIKDHAEKKGMSLNSYIIDVIKKDMEN